MTGRIVPTRKRIPCVCCGKEVLAVPLVWGESTRERQWQARRGEIMYWGYVPAPWQWACPNCGRPIPSEDDHWDLVAGPEEDLRQVKREWERILYEQV